MDDIREQKHYITNEELMPYIFKYRQTGSISEELGEMIYMIADNYSKAGKFRNYTYREDMVAEAVYTILRYIHNFDPIRYEKPNPFAYFTSITKNAFLNYIRKQKKHSKIKDVCYNNCQFIIDENEFFTKDTKAIDYTVIKENGIKDK